ncbi:hypothetical protein ACW7GZ_13225 [Luteimonas sp. A537]
MSSKQYTDEFRAEAVKQVLERGLTQVSGFMKKIRPFVAVALVPGVVLFLAFVGYTAGDVYMRGNCDQQKFGCLGNIQFAAFAAGVMLICSFSGHLLVCSILRKAVRELRGRRLVWVVATLSLGQGALIASVDRFPGGSVPGMMAAWAAISAFMALIALSAARTWPPAD